MQFVPQRICPGQRIGNCRYLWRVGAICLQRPRQSGATPQLHRLPHARRHPAHRRRYSRDFDRWRTGERQRCHAPIHWGELSPCRPSQRKAETDEYRTATDCCCVGDLFESGRKSERARCPYGHRARAADRRCGFPASVAGRNCARRVRPDHIGKWQNG